MILPLIDFDMDTYLSYQNVTEVCNQILLEKGSLVEGVMIGAKILGVTFVLLYWLTKYAQGLKPDASEKKLGLTPHNIVVGILYVFLIIGFNHVTDWLDRGLGAYEASFGVEMSSEMYKALDDDWIKEDQDAITSSEDTDVWDTTVQMAKDVGTMLMNMGDIWWWGLQLLKFLGWLVNAMVMPIFLLERGFLLLIMKIACPLILALGANEIYRDLVKRWILLYCAIFLTGLFFIFATQFCDEAYRSLVVNGDMADDNWSKVIIFAVVVFAKVKLYKGAVELSYKIFNA